MARLGILVLCVLAVAGCGGSRSERGPSRQPVFVTPPAPKPRPVRWPVSHPQGLDVPTRMYTISLGRQYTDALVLEVPTDANGDHRPDLIVTADRSRGGASRPERLFFYSHSPLGSSSLAQELALGRARRLPLASPQPNLTYRGAASDGFGSEDMDGHGDFDLVRLSADRAQTSYPCGDTRCGSMYEAVQVSVGGGRSTEIGGDWVRTVGRPPEYPVGSVWGLGDWNGDGRADLLEGAVDGVRVLAVTKDGVRELPLPQIDTPAGRSLAFPVAVDIDGDGRAEAVGVRRGPTGLSVVIVARA